MPTLKLKTLSAHLKDENLSAHLNSQNPKCPPPQVPTSIVKTLTSNVTTQSPP